jgi:hypothetical protein
MIRITDRTLSCLDGFELSAKPLSRFLETRNVSKYCVGSEDCEGKEDRWASVISAVSDCRAVLALRVGQVPEQRLNDSGIDIVTTYERIETAVLLAAQKYRP